MSQLPRPEHPRPQFVRPGWMNLNGTWQFEIDHGATGRARGLIDAPYTHEITVPFCPESKLSGIEYRDFMAAVWYRRTFTLPEAAHGKRVLLHFGAVDFRCEAWVNGKSVGVHEGGYVSFTFEITDALVSGENTLVVCADDNQRSGFQPYGKQSERYESHDCSYSRTTGIWQTVWLEWVEPAYIRKVRMIPDAANGSLYLDATIDGCNHGMTLTAEASFGGEPEAEGTVLVDGGHARLALTVKNKHLWGPGEGNLYDLRLTLAKDGKPGDVLDSYFALRTVSLDGMKCLVNGKPVFQRLVLDQGFYPDGIYTAPTDEALKHDIEMSMAMGFNGARLHQKVFEPRFHYWADRLGYLCWGEMPSWGIDTTLLKPSGVLLREWLEAVERDFCAPSIIGWCPYNEVWCESLNGLRNLTLQMAYRVTKAADPSRLVIDSSGGLHCGETDIFDTHDYEQSVDIYKERYKPSAPLYDQFEGREHYTGGPRFVSEYGGIFWSTDKKGWGYGVAPKSREEFLARYEGLTTALLDNPDIMGFCYTQLTDVEQEQNGLYTYDRQPKFPPESIAAVNCRKAAMED